MSNLAIFPANATEPMASAVGHAVLLPMEIAWAAHCFRSAAREGSSRRKPVLLVLGASYVLVTVDSLALVAYSALYLRCDLPYVHVRPAADSSRCPALTFYAVRDFLTPLATAVFITGSMSRFFDTVRALGERATVRFLVASRAATLLATLLKLAAVAMYMQVLPLQPVARARTFANGFQKQTDLVFYTMLGALDVVATVLAFRYIIGVLRESMRVLKNQAWMARSSPHVARLKTRERRLLYFASLMLAVNVANFAAYAGLYSTSYMDKAGVSVILQNLVFTVQLRMFAFCEMFAINAMAAAVWCSNQAAQRTSAPPTAASGLAFSGMSGAHGKTGSTF